jgi:hypothetical protein
MGSPGPLLAIPPASPADLQHIAQNIFDPKLVLQKVNYFIPG